MAEDEQLLLRAEIFRSKLIEHFQLLDTATETCSEEVPRYFSDEFKCSADLDSMMRTSPNALVKFEVYNERENPTYTDKRLNRIKTKNTVPMGPWAKMVVEDSRFQNFMLILIFSNSIVLGIESEIASMNSSPYKEIKVFLDILDYLALMVFILEILLKWTDGFFEFWKNGWNDFDFFVTVLSFVPELITAASPKNSKQSIKIVADNLRTLRILRALKMVSRFAQMRIIVMTILKALKSMVFVIILLATIMYIFAVTGTVMFSAHHKSNKGDAHFKNLFRNLANSLLTLFQLLTLDHWFELLQDLGKTSNVIFTNLYIILWICVGAFIFRNVFTGIMVMNFQNIRNEFVMQCKEQEKALKESERLAKLEEELTKQYQLHSTFERQKINIISSSYSKSSSLSVSLPGSSRMCSLEENIRTYYHRENNDDEALQSSMFETNHRAGVSQRCSGHNETKQMSCRGQIPIAKSSPYQYDLSIGDWVEDVSQPGACQTSSIAIFPCSHTGRSPNAGRLSGEVSPLEAGNSIGQLLLKDVSPIAELRPIASMIASQCSDDRRVNTLGWKSDVGSIQKSNDEQMLAGHGTSAVKQTFKAYTKRDEHRILNQDLMLSPRSRSHFGWVSNEDQVLGPKLIVNPKQDSDKYQQVSKHQALDVNRKTDPHHISRTCRFSGSSRISDISQVADGGILVSTTGESHDISIVDIVPGEDSKQGENILVDDTKWDRAPEEYDTNNIAKEYNASSNWNKTITANLTNIKDSTNETLWPRDVLFRYFQLMESLQDNLAERCQLQNLAVLALNQMHEGDVK